MWKHSVCFFSTPAQFDGTKSTSLITAVQLAIFFNTKVQGQDAPLKYHLHSYHIRDMLKIKGNTKRALREPQTRTNLLQCQQGKNPLWICYMSLICSKR